MNESVRRKIEEELKLGMKLNHPHLVRIFVVVSLPPHGPCLVLELCQGGSLRALLDRVHDNPATNLSWNKRIKFLKEIAFGMAQLHSLPPNPIIHRDLKAVNVLLAVLASDASTARKEQH